jgi:endoglucanase
MDHPAFVVAQVCGARELAADFRGHVQEQFFVGSPVLLHGDGGRPARGRVAEFERHKGPWLDGRARIVFARDVTARPGDILTWDVGVPRIKAGRLQAPSCDDPAGVAAALAALDMLLGERGFRGDVRVLLTRAEEVGFVGAIAACRAAALPRSGRYITLETSKSFPESPIGGGPVLRVGDKTGIFDPDLTYRLSRIAEAVVVEDPSFLWQRKLMPGGTCEASVFQTYGFTAAACCVPLGNYHNMNEATGCPAAETISLADFDGLVRLLAAFGRNLDDTKRFPPLKERLEGIFAQRRGLLDKI